jgi:prolyl-tRNA synthetase
VASSHVVLLPIVRKSGDRSEVMAFTENLAKELREKVYHNRRLRVEIDDRDIGGARGWEWIKKGIPLRVEIGPRDIADNSVFVGRRDKGHKEKRSLKRDHFVGEMVNTLDEIQQNLFERAVAFKEAHTVDIEDKDDFYDFFTPQDAEKPEIHGGFVLSGWCGADECESKIKEDLSVTIRCIPFNDETQNGKCVCCSSPGKYRVVFAKAY